MFCTNCGHENEGTANFCQKCGHVMPQSDGHLASTIAGPGAAALSDRYQILGTLGEGGMGVVYRARDNELDEVLAIKVLQTGGIASGDDIKRFKREITTARKITHTNVVRIHDFGATDENVFISMELVDGGSVADLIARGGALPVEEAMRIALETARGLFAAHKEGVIHRDIKPHNILLEKSGKVKLADFGIARLAAKTQNTGFAGTPHYISPEQARGQPATIASDLYSLGVVMYQMLTGTLPFEADSLVALVMKHAEEPPEPLRTRRPALPQQVEDIVLRLMVKNPGARYADAGALVKELHSFLAGDPVTPPTPNRVSAPAATPVPPPPGVAPPPRKKGRGGIAFLIVSMVLLVGIGLALAIYQLGLDAETARLEALNAVAAMETPSATPRVFKTVKAGRSGALTRVHLHLPTSMVVDVCGTTLATNMENCVQSTMWVPAGGCDLVWVDPVTNDRFSMQHRVMPGGDGDPVTVQLQLR